MPPNEWLLHNAASSVLGRELIQMAKRYGTKLINVVRRREAVADLKKLGYNCQLSGCPRNTHGLIDADSREERQREKCIKSLNIAEMPRPICCKGTTDEERTAVHALLPGQRISYYRERLS